MASKAETPASRANERLMELLLDQGEITWQTIINELVSSGEIDPWDVDISHLVARFIEMITNLKEMNFFISGKLVLASALLLKIKSKHLLHEGIEAFDQLLHPDEPYDLEELAPESAERRRRASTGQKLIPRTPQPRKRKVSIQDLMRALEKALDQESKRRGQKLNQVVMQVPKRERDVTQMIDEVYQQITTHYEAKSSTMTFTDLVPSEAKEDKVLTFIPLLHLDTQQRIDMLQKLHFGEINIQLTKRAAKPAEEENP